MRKSKFFKLNPRNLRLCPVTGVGESITGFWEFLASVIGATFGLISCG